MNPYNFSILCFGFCSLLLGLFVWLKREDEIGKRYFVMALFYSGWAFFIAINLNNDISPERGLFMGRLGNCFAVFIPVSWYHFVVTYTGDIYRRSKVIRSLYLVSIVIACFGFSPWFVPKVVPMVDFKYYPQAGIIYYFSTLLFFTLVPLSFITLWKKLKKVTGHECQQLKGLFWASLVGYLGGAPTFLPTFGIPFPQFTLLLLPVYPFALAYFMIRQKLFDMEELAQAAHRDKLVAIGVLAASINHEVKNPLFVIKGLAESWLEREKEGIFRDSKQTIENGRDAMKRSMEQADRAMDIIKRLSLFAKAGIEGEIKFESVGVAGVLEDILPLVRYELAAHNIVLTREIPKNLPEVRADRRYLEEILFNLIVNACQALKEKPAEREVRVCVSPAPASEVESRATLGHLGGGQGVTVTVADNGPGIPVKQLEAIFRPFYTTKAEGTGLGLYITKQLVEKIGGRIDVQSSVGAGTTFTVKLSIAPQDG